MILIAVVAAAVYAYSVSSKIKVADKPAGGCSSCPKNDAGSGV